MRDVTSLLCADLRRMTPTATTLSALLHGLMALVMYAELPRFPGRANDTTIDISIDLLSAPPAKPTGPWALLSDGPPNAPAMASLGPAELQRDEPTAPLAPRTEPRFEEALPPIGSTPPPVESRDFAQAKPAPSAKAAPPRPALQPAAAARVANTVHQGPSLAMTNDATQRTAQDDYLWQVIRKLAQYRYASRSRDDPERGLVVTRVAVSRDGRLVDVSLAKSSGSPNLDRGILDTIRRAAPFAPLPADIQRDPYVFILPVNYVQDR